MSVNLEEVNVLLQVHWQLHNATSAAGNATFPTSSFAAIQLAEQTLRPALLKIGAEVAQALVICSFSALALLFAYFLIRGLPQKAAQDPKVKQGCPGSWVVYMGLVYAFVFFSTDQYLASLPQMGVDLGGSQWIMSASIQTVFAIKGVVGIGTAALSDRIGRRPVLLACSLLLSLASFCCGCAGHVEWFLAARVLQALGMAVEPTVWAMTRDYFENPEERLVIVTAMMIMNLMGASVAPMVGNIFAELLGGWRSSFFVVAIIWAIMGLYAWMAMKESCPDVEGRTQTENFLRILEPHSICLLLGQGCFVAAYMTFIGNISYLAETTFGLSPRASSAIMLVYPACTVLGLVLMNRSHFSSLQIARVTVALFTFIGLVSFVLASYFSDFLWSYLLGSFSQATVQTVGVVSLNVLFFAPLEDCAGVAAAYDMIARSFVPSVFSLISTQALIHFGAKGLSQFQASTCLAAGVVFSYYAISPPSQEETEEAHESNCDS